MRTKEEIQKDIDTTKGLIDCHKAQLENDKKFLLDLEDELHRLERGWGLGSEIESGSNRGIVVYGDFYAYHLRLFKKDGTLGSATRYIRGFEQVKVIKP